MPSWIVAEDRNRTAAGYLHAAAEQGGDVHGAAVAIKQLALDAVFGEDTALLRNPEKGLWALTAE